MGEIICFESKIVYTGKSRMVAYIEMKGKAQVIVKGFITFVNVDAEGHALPHGIVIMPETPEDIELKEQAANLPNP